MRKADWTVTKLFPRLSKVHLTIAVKRRLPHPLLKCSAGLFYGLLFPLLFPLLSPNALFCIFCRIFVPVQPQAPFQVRGRAQAPVVAFNVRPAFAFEMYSLALRSKYAKRTGQLRIFYPQKQKHLHLPGLILYNASCVTEISFARQAFPQP